MSGLVRSLPEYPSAAPRPSVIGPNRSGIASIASPLVQVDPRRDTPDQGRAASVEPVRIATWNVNSVIARLPRLVDWLGIAEPDVLCLQELKTAEFPIEAVSGLGYEVAMHSTGRWNGVAILSRVGIESERAGLLDEPGYQPEDAMLEATEPRAVGATCGGVRLWSVDVPNGREVGHAHYASKLQWLDALRATVAQELPS